MRAVKAAEQNLHESQTTKTYLGLLGDLVFVDAMRELVFGGATAKILEHMTVPVLMSH